MVLAARWAPLFLVRMAFLGTKSKQREDLGPGNLDSQIFKKKEATGKIEQAQLWNAPVSSTSRSAYVGRSWG